jgi:hypothetical protein
LTKITPTRFNHVKFMYNKNERGASAHLLVKEGFEEWEMFE